MKNVRAVARTLTEIARMFARTIGVWFRELWSYVAAQSVLAIFLGAIICGVTYLAVGPSVSSRHVDPYVVFEHLAPAGHVRLSRDDAAVRATLGCGETFPPHTTDWALQRAYGTRTCHR